MGVREERLIRILPDLSKGFHARLPLTLTLTSSSVDIINVPKHLTKYTKC